MPSTKDFSPFVPFDLYDFFGYLFPGILFAVSTVIFYGQINSSFWGNLYPDSTTNPDNSFLVGLVIVVGAIVLLYTLGHFIATLSHIIIDRVLIDGVEGYPVIYYLNIPRPSRPFSESTFKYLFTLFNLLLLTPILISNYQLFFWISISLLAGIALLIFQRIIIMMVRSRPRGQETARRVGKGRIFQLFLYPSKFLIDPFIGFLRRLLGLDRKFSKTFIALYKSLFTKRFGKLKPDDIGSENYWLSVFSVFANHDVHYRTLHTWLHLYGFARNAAASFFLSSSLIVGYLLFNPQALTPNIQIQLGILWSLAVFMGIRYWILYSHYYTKGVIRAFVEVETRK